MAPLRAPRAPSRPAPRLRHRPPRPHAARTAARAAASDGGALTERELDGWTKVELKEECQRRGLSMSGLKAELVERLLAHPQHDASQFVPHMREPVADTAALFPDGGPMPGKYRVHLVELQAELRRRGAANTGGSKDELYHRLRKLVLGLASDDDDDAAAPSTAEGEALVGGFTLAELVSTEFDPAALSMAQLADVLRAFGLPTAGRKAELIARLQPVLADEVTAAAMAANLRGEVAPEWRARATEEERRVRAQVAAMQLDDVLEDMRARGEVATGPEAIMRERLTRLLLSDREGERGAARYAAVNNRDLERSVARLSDAQLVAELRQLGGSPEGLSRGEMEAAVVAAGVQRRARANGAGPLMEDLCDEDDAEAAAGGLLQQDVASATHHLLRDITPRVRVAVLMGGPGREAPQSLASARTVVDALRTRPHPEQMAQLEAALDTCKRVQAGMSGAMERVREGGISVELYYIDTARRPWRVPPQYVYSTSTLEFEHCLAADGTPFASLQDMAADMRGACDFALPVLHGAFGEGGEVQAVLEEAGVEFVGSPAEACARTFDKAAVRDALLELEFPALPQCSLHADDFEDAGELSEAARARLLQWMQDTGLDLDQGVVVVKPSDGGAGLGVTAARGIDEAAAAAAALTASDLTDRVVVEPKMLGAVEFSVCVLETEGGLIALPPSTPGFSDPDFDIARSERERRVDALKQQAGHVPLSELMDDEVPDNMMDYRKKNLPTSELRVQTPPSLPADAVQAIRRSAERAFRDLGLRDAARFDGWVVIEGDVLMWRTLQQQVLSTYRPELAVPDEMSLPGPQAADIDEAFLRGSGHDADVVAEEGEELLRARNEEAFGFDASRDRYVTQSQLDAAEVADANAELANEEALDEARARGADPFLWPQDGKKVALGRSGAMVSLFALPPVAEQLTPRELAMFDGGGAIFSEVNPFVGLAACSAALQQAAAAGMSDTSLLRTLANCALRRLQRPPLRAAGDAGRLDPLTEAELKDFPDLVELLNRDAPPSQAELCAMLREEGPDGAAVATALAAGADLEDDSPLDEMIDIADEDGDGVAELSESEALDALHATEEALDVAAASLEAGGAGSGADDAEADGEDGDASGGASSSGDDAEAAGEDRDASGDVGSTGDDAEASTVVPADALGAEIGAELDRSSDTAAAGPGSEEDAARAQERRRVLRRVAARMLESPHPVPPGQRQRVYVLCGGESAERHASLVSAAATWQRLRQCPDLSASLFVVAPPDAGHAASERRSALLKRRNMLLGVGVGEEDLEEELSLTAIRRMTYASQVALEDRVVWGVPHAVAARSSVEDVVEACERLGRMRATAEHALPPAAVQARELQLQMCWELGLAGAVGVGEAFEGLDEAIASTTDLDGLIRSAQDEGAVVFNCLQGGIGADGRLQATLERAGVCFTGSSELASTICADKLDTAEQLQALAEAGVYGIPFFEVTLEDLIAFAEEPAYFASAMDDVREQLQLDEAAALCIKPARDGGSTGVMRVEEPADLALYARAIVEEWPYIPAELVSGAFGPLALPHEPPKLFSIQPFIATDEVKLEPGPDGTTQVTVTEQSNFVEVTIGLVGSFGSMRAMTPSVLVKHGDVLTYEDKYGVGVGAALTPPPPEVASPEALSVAMERAETVANALQVSGCVRLDAFMHRTDGTMYVMEVNTVPSLIPGSVMYQQALLEEPTLYPEDFLRYQILLALDRANQDPGVQPSAELRQGSSGGGGGRGSNASLEHEFAAASAAGEGDFLKDELDWIEAS